MWASSSIDHDHWHKKAIHQFLFCVQGHVHIWFYIAAVRLGSGGFEGGGGYVGSVCFVGKVMYTLILHCSSKTKSGGFGGRGVVGFLDPPLLGGLAPDTQAYTQLYTSTYNMACTMVFTAQYTCTCEHCINKTFTKENWFYISSTSLWPKLAQTYRVYINIYFTCYVCVFNQSSAYYLPPYCVYFR